MGVRICDYLEGLSNGSCEVQGVGKSRHRSDAGLGFQLFKQNEFFGFTKRAGL